MDNKKIGNFIRNLRKEVGLTQKELAEKIGVTDRAISKWERGLGCPDISLLEDVAKELNVSILELLKGEHIVNKDELKEKDLIESMTLSKNIIINKFKKYFNIFTILIVSFICLIIAFQNLKNMYFVIRKYDMDDYYVDNSVKLENLYNKYELILSNQGKYSDEDYNTISSYIKIMRERLDEQHNDQYLNINKYNYFKILSFYLDHQNLYYIQIDNIDLYEILLKYDNNIYRNVISYSDTHDGIIRELSNTLFFLEQPYFNYSILEFDGYVPNIYGIIRNIYDNEIMLCDDIIKVGEL